MLQAETRELLEGVARVATWTDSDAQDAPARRLARARTMLQAYTRLAAADPVGLERVAQGARRYARTLRRLGVADPWSLELPRVTALRALGKLAGAFCWRPWRSQASPAAICRIDWRASSPDG